MKKRLSKLALLAVAAAFVLAGFPACSDDDENEPPPPATATFTDVDIPEGGLVLTAGEPKEVTATLTVTNTTFSVAVKGLDKGASLESYIAQKKDDKDKVNITSVKVAEKAGDTTMKVTFTLTADTDAAAGTTGEIKATLKAPALMAAKDVEVTETISYTVSEAAPGVPKATFEGDGITLTSGEESTATATVTLENAAFAEAITKDSFAAKAGNGVTVTVTAAERKSDTEATLTLSMTAQANAEDGTVSVTINKDALAERDDGLTAVGTISYTVIEPGEMAAGLTCTIGELTAGEAKEAAATVTLTNGTFATAITKDNFTATASNDKVTVTVKDATKKSDTEAALTLSITAADGAQNGTVSVTINKAALTNSAKDLTTPTTAYTVKAQATTPPAGKTPTATLAGEAVELTAGAAKDATTTVKLTDGTFAAAITKDNFAAKASDSKVTVTVKEAKRTSDTEATLTLSVTAAEAGNGTVTVTVNVGAVKDHNKAVAAGGSIAYTIKEKVVEPPETVFTLTEASATISLGKKSISANDYLTYTANMYNSNAQTFADVTDNYPNISSTDRTVEISVKNVASFKVYVKNSTKNRKFNITIGNGAAITVYHPASVDGSDIVSFAFNTGTTEETKISIGGANDGSVYPGYIVLSDTEETIGVKSVKISDAPESSVALADNSLTVTATALKDNYTETTVTWSSSDETVATVADGIITFKAAGKTTISATAGEQSDSFELEVVDGDIAVTGVTLSPTKASVKLGETKTLTATVEPENATNNTVSWTSSDSAIATVSDEGVVTAIAEGTVTITVTTQDSAKTATCEVTVYKSNTAGTSYTELFEKYKTADGDDFKDFAALTCTATTYTFESGVSFVASTSDKFETNILTAGEQNFAIDVSNRLVPNKAAPNATSSVVNVPVAGTCKVTVLWYNNGTSDRGIYMTSTNGNLVDVEGPDKFTNGVGEDNKKAWSTCNSQQKANNTSVFTYVSDSSDTLKITNSTAAGARGGGGIYIYGIIVEY